MENISEGFVEKLFQMSQEEFPEKVWAKARECFIDYLACLIGGCRTYEDINKDYIEKNKLTGDCHVAGIKQKTDLRTAVMINAFNAHVLELDDSHRVAMTHLGAPIFSALMGVAEVYGCSVKQLLRGTVVGYEAAIRLANTIQPGHKKRGFHVSGTCCTVGSAIGIAAMLDYTQQQMQSVLSASVTSAAGLLAVISGKSEQKPYNVANAAMVGVNAALYGKYFIGAVDILGDSRGFFRAVTDEIHVEKLLEDGYAIESIYQKLYSSCRHCHAPMEAMLKIRAKHEFKGCDVKKIKVKVYDLAIKGHDHTEITGISSARQSIPYGIAVACLYQDCGIDAFTQEKVSNEELLEIVRKVKVVEAPELTVLVPGKRAAIVNVDLSDGVHYSERIDYAKGEPENPITDAEWKNKFYTLACSAGMDKNTAAQMHRFITEANEEPVSSIFHLI